MRATGIRRRAERSSAEKAHFLALDRASSRAPHRIAKKKAYDAQEHVLARKRTRIRAWRRTEEGAAYIKAKNATPEAKIRMALRNRAYEAIIRRGFTKSRRSVELLGAPIPLVKLWLAAQWKPGMHWGNIGEWHIDHVRPCASFDLSDPAQQLECFNFRNLQPLWAIENLRKAASFL